MKNPQKIFARLGHSKNLPSLPQVLIKLIELCNSEDTTAQDLSGIIARDPSISSNVMRLVNSSYMGLTSRISSLEQAVVYLGADTIKNVSISTSVLQAFGLFKGNSHFSLHRFWWHSLTCAAIARRLAAKVAYSAAEEAFLSGLLHDIGKLLLWVNFPEEYARVVEACDSSHDLIAREEQLLGVNHCEVGAWLIRQWKLNSFMTDAILYHHEPTDNILEAFPLVRIVFVANQLCRGYGRDPAAGHEAASAVFGLDASQSEEIRIQAREEGAEVARSFGIQIEAPATPAEDHPPQPTAESDTRQELLVEIRDISLLYGTLQNLLRADCLETILKVIERGLQILFDVRRIFFFLYDGQRDLLVGHSPRGDAAEELLNGLEVPFHSDKSLLIRSLYQGILADSFGSAGPGTIADAQILRLLETAGMLCLPMVARKKRVGVIVLGVSEARFRALAAQDKLLTMFASHAALCLHMEDMKQSQARAIQSERLAASSTIARRVAHEVNNPLAIIKNYLRILGLKLPEKHPAQNELQIIAEEIDRVGHITEQLSAFSEPDKEQGQPVDVNLMIRELLQIIEPSILQPANIQIDLSLASGLPRIPAGKNSLKQVLINLIKNAAEALGSGGNLHIETRRTASSGRRLGAPGEAVDAALEIIVRDDGPGIPENIRQRLFEPFNSAKGGAHSGLGLSIVHNIISELDGSITCHSEAQKGTTFNIILPLSRIEQR